MKRMIMGATLGRAIGAVLMLGSALSAARADTWVFRDNLRPNGHDRSMAAKRADARKCGANRSGRSFSDASAPDMRDCMFARGWVLDHVIPDPPSVQANNPGNADDSPPVDNSSNDDWVQRQRDQDNLQDMINNQQMLNSQQMQNDQMFQQQQQQMNNQ
jgi:hypothetical protein